MVTIPGVSEHSLQQYTTATRILETLVKTGARVLTGLVCHGEMLMTMFQVRHWLVGLTTDGIQMQRK